MTQLAPSMILREALCLFVDRRIDRAGEPQIIQPTEGVTFKDLSQKNVDLLLTADELALPLAKLSNRFLKPAMHLLSDEIPVNGRFSPVFILISRGAAFGANERYHLIAMRMLGMRTPKRGEIRLRFDVRYI